MGGDEVQGGLVTTIIPVYNRPSLLRQAVASVVEQTYPLVEVIIVDDGSTDETGSVADDLAGVSPRVIRVVHKRNEGPGAAREAGRQIARGEFIQYLDSDDLLLARKFEKQVAGLRAHPECGVAYGKTRYYRLDREDDAKVFKDTGQVFERILPGFLIERRWGTSTPLYRREVTDRVGPWLNVWAEEDWEYDFRIGTLGVLLFYSDEFVSEQRGLPGARLSQAGRDDVRMLQSQARARDRIMAHALAAGLLPGSPEMHHFARQLFMLARDCGVAGLVEDARHILSLARLAAGPDYFTKLECWAYGVVSRTCGWWLPGRLAGAYERMRDVVRR